MENDIIKEEDPIMNGDVTLAPTDDVIPPEIGLGNIATEEIPDIPVDPDCLGCGELTPEEPIQSPQSNPNTEECPEVPEMGLGSVTVGQYFGTIQESVTISWRLHFKTRKSYIHDALHTFYTSALYMIDELIEQYQGICGVIDEPFTNCITSEEKPEMQYLQELKEFVENNKTVIGCHSEILSTLDNYLGAIDKALYKITNFNENAIQTYEDFCNNEYDGSCNEAVKYDQFGNRSSDDPDDDDYDPEYGEEDEECKVCEEE